MMIHDELPAILADDDAYAALRSMMIDHADLSADPADYDTDLATYAIIAELLESLFSDDRTEREQLTELALNLSLCPIHFHDYAICFDDATCAETLEPTDPALASALDYTAECAQIRLIHPLHDT